MQCIILMLFNHLCTKGVSWTHAAMMNLIVISISITVTGIIIVAFLLFISWLKLKQKKTSYNTQNLTNT